MCHSAAAVVAATPKDTHSEGAGEGERRGGAEHSELKKTNKQKKQGSF